MIVLLSHAMVQKYEDPERDAYDRLLPDLHKKSVNLLCEFVDILGFANLQITTVSKDNGPNKAKTNGERILYLTPRGGFSAGNRYGLPDSLPFEWKAIAEHLKLKGKAAKKEIEPTQQQELGVN
mgnify:CR=1 FL=1